MCNPITKMNAQDKIEQYLVSSERNFARVRDWGKGSVDGYLKIDMGKYAVLSELKRELKLSASTIYKACNQLEKKNIILIENRRPFGVWLKEKHLMCVSDPTVKY